MLQIPLQQTPNQALRFHVGDDACQVTLFQKRCGMFLNVYVEDDPVAVGVLCVNMRALVRSWRFPGELLFRDTQGTKDPFWQGLEERFHLLYIPKDEVHYLGEWR